MGFRLSPYNAIRHYYHAEEFVIGDPKEPGSPLQWDRIILNLPGFDIFDPRLPWVFKWDDERSCISGAVVMFVEDGRGSGGSVEHSWQVLHRCATRLQYLGIQFAIRKIRPPVRWPGAWAGIVIRTAEDYVKKMVAQEKWDKTKRLLLRLTEELASSEDGQLDFKTLESDRGFLTHMAGTYHATRAYLKGYHQTLDS
jgi:hypothetical protein